MKKTTRERKKKKEREEKYSVTGETSRSRIMERRGRSVSRQKIVFH